MPAVAHRLNNLPPYVFVTIGKRIKEMQAGGADVIRLDIGSPDLPPPDAVIETLAKSAHNPNNHGYMGYSGTPGFRQAVARYYQRRFGVTINPDTQVLPLLGSKEGLVNLSLTYLDRGDLALVPTLGYPSYQQGAILAGADVHWVPMDEEDNFHIILDDIPADVRKKAKLLWVNYPNNPTGGTADVEYYNKLVAFCQENDILLASDNPYVDVTYDNYVAPSALEAKNALDCTVEFMSLSKTYNMGGWRIGAAVGSADALANLLTVKSNIDTGHFKAIYDAGATALDETTQEWFDWRNGMYQKRRDRVLEILRQIGLHAAKPSGSLYIWAKTEMGDGEAYVQECLEKAQVSFAPGAAYGPAGKPYIRISLGIDDDRLEVVLDRLKTWYGSR